MNKRVLLIAILVVITTIGYAKKTSTTYYEYETECLGVAQDGSQTLIAWGAGRTRDDAKQQAMKNALNDVIFKGIRSGNELCNTKPLIFEANAREKYEDFFNFFFSENGDYKKFVTDDEGGRRLNRTKELSKREKKFGIVVMVYRPQLKEYLKSNGIIK
ncbi:MAG: hypothetical protein IKW05_05110 [Muribaculaceae bacterium]|nr:hypothetical protein [Bacteroidales bacterium]MBR5241296.1 hypothetical protein [Muribaculaceae bacterium]MBR5533192.1 hypothetical protein [Bacteroidales bacterium]